MAKGAPVVVGTSVLNPGAKAPALSSFKGLPSVGGGAVSAVNPLLSQFAAQGKNAGSPLPGLAAIIQAATGATKQSAVDNIKGFGALPDQNLGNTYVQLTGSAGNKGANALAGLGAALAMARKELGGFDASPFDQAISAIQSAAGSSQSEAQKQAAQAEADDAALYGRLNNFVSDTAQAGRKDTRQTGKAIGKNYNSEQAQLNQVFGDTDKASAAAMARLGINPTTATGGGQEDEQFLRGEAASNKANAKSNNRSSGDAFNQLMQETKGDTRATGSADVASEKSGLNATLASIAQQLSSQLASVNESEATARSSHHDSVRAQAASLLAAQQAAQQANDPNTLTNQLKAAEIANTEASALAKDHALQQGPTATDPYGKAEALINNAAPQLAPGRAGTALDWLKRAETGDLGSHDPQTGWAGVNTKDLANVLQSAQKVFGQHPGFGVPAQNVLLHAIEMLAGR